MKNKGKLTKETEAQPEIQVLRDRAQLMSHAVKFFLVQRQSKEGVSN